MEWSILPWAGFSLLLLFPRGLSQEISLFSAGGGGDWARKELGSHSLALDLLGRDELGTSCERVALKSCVDG